VHVLSTDFLYSGRVCASASVQLGLTHGHLHREQQLPQPCDGRDASAEGAKPDHDHTR
jgi:hypothetical protein